MGGLAAALLCGAALLTGCSLNFSAGTSATSRDWSPAPVRVDGLSVLATADEDGFRLRTVLG